MEGFRAELDDAKVRGLGDEVMAPEVVDQRRNVQVEIREISGRQPGVGRLAPAVLTRAEVAIRRERG